MEAGKVPVVFIHGLWLHAESWGPWVEAFAEAKLHGEVWDDLPPARAWKVVTRAMLSAFYSHPWAWNEIGFGGPAYPRGYARMGVGQRESWEGAPAFERDPVKDTEQRGVQGT